MGLLNDLKKMFFGASSVAKSAANKTGDFILDESQEFMDKVKESSQASGEKLSENATKVKDLVVEGTKEVLHNTKEKISEIADNISANPTVQKAAAFTEDVGEKVLDKGSEILDKAANISETVGEKVIEKGGEALEKAAGMSETVGEKVLDIKDDMVEKAKETLDRASDKLSETMDKAEAWAAEEAAKPKKDFADDTLDASGSLLDGKDDFFSKADKFADGEYEAFSEGKITIESSEKTKKIDTTPATGFEDLDGDGNEIIDDAIIDSEE